MTTTEIEKFNKIANQWWNPSGPFKPLHHFNSTRITAIVSCIKKHFNIHQDHDPFQNLKLLDVGCGGGLVSEPMARLGASVVGIDASEESIIIAKQHAKKEDLSIIYQVGDVDNIQGKFDIILCLELIEHIVNPHHLIHLLASRLHSHGIILISTINRTIKSYLLAIVGAEYILRWLPKGTHNWCRFIKPGELAEMLIHNQLSPQKYIGFQYNPLFNTWSKKSDYSVNYMICATF